MPSADASIVNKLGLHARSSAKLTQLAGGFECEIWISRTGRRVSAKSIMGVMMLAAGIGSTVKLEAEGKDADKALAAMDLSPGTEAARTARTRLFGVLRDMVEHSQNRWLNPMAAAEPVDPNRPLGRDRCRHRGDQARRGWARGPVRRGLAGDLRSGHEPGADGRARSLAR